MNPKLYILPKALSGALYALPPLPIPRRIVNLIVSSGLTPMWVRWFVLVLWGVDARSWVISERCYFGGRDISIGRDCGLNMGVWFDNTAHISLGDGVRVGPGVQFITSSHPLGPPERRCGMPVEPKPIIVGKGAWLTGNVTVGPGVTIGEGAVVAMGSVVTKDLAAHGFYAGAPAKLVKMIDDAPGQPAAAGAAA